MLNVPLLVLRRSVSDCLSEVHDEVRPSNHERSGARALMAAISPSEMAVPFTLISMIRTGPGPSIVSSKLELPQVSW